MLVEYQNLLKALAPLGCIKEDINDDKPLISHEALNDAYVNIKNSCDSFDYDNVEHIIKSLEEYSFPENEALRFNDLKKAIDNFDYDLIPEILAQKEG